MLSSLIEDPDEEIKKKADSSLKKQIAPLFEYFNRFQSNYAILSEKLVNTYPIINNTTEFYYKQFNNISNSLASYNLSKFVETSGIVQAAEIAQKINENFSKQVSSLSQVTIQFLNYK